MSFFGLNFGQNAEIDILLDGQEERKMAEIKDENGRKERHFLYYDGESVSGKVNVTLHRKTNRLEHQGIRIEFIGQIELYYDRGNHHEFLSLVKQLAGPGELVQNTSFDFEFNQVEKPFECYTGANVRLRYFIRVTVVRRLTDLTKELDLLVHTLATYPEMNNPIKMEVGIEECLHIEFEYNKSKYHLKDVIVGKIYFLLVRIKIKHMEVAIIKRETTGSGPNTFHDNETIAKYEIMDGAPVKGESIPIRVFLAGYDLTPTMRDVNKKFSVKYYLNLVLVDEEERRYFKQQEITLWRKGERQRKGVSHPSSSAAHPHPHNHSYQVPHAMARHIAGDQPSANARTAPTPSEPNTPVSAMGSEANDQDENESSPLPGPSSSSRAASKKPSEMTREPPATPPMLPSGHKQEMEQEDPSSEPEMLEKEELLAGNSNAGEEEADAEEKKKLVQPKKKVDPQEDGDKVEINDDAIAKSSSGAKSAVPESPQRLFQSPPPMEDLTLDDDDEDEIDEIGDNNADLSSSHSDEAKFEEEPTSNSSSAQQQKKAKKAKEKEPVPS